MPTGYTCIIEDNEETTFKDYLIRCAHAFCSHLREESSSSPLTFVKQSNYYLKQIKEAEKNLKKAESLTLENVGKIIEKSKKNFFESKERYETKTKKLTERYNKILNEAKNWVPPTPQHAELKKFMIEQIEISKPTESHYYKHWHFPKPEEYIEDEIERAKRDLNYYREQYKIEVRRIEETNKWISDLLRSV